MRAGFECMGSLRAAFLISAGLAFFFVAVTAQLHADDAQSLSILAQHWANLLDGPLPWTQSTVEQACDVWRGVSCSGPVLRVTSLNLSGEWLTASLPQDLPPLPFLQVLDISSTGSSGLLPLDWTPFANLTQLVLSNNSLTGDIPSSIGSLANLEVLKLDVNQISGTLPDLSRCPRLRALELGGSNKQLLFPSTMDQLLDLEVLDFQGAFTTAFPNVVGLPKLKTLAGGFSKMPLVSIPDELVLPSLEALILTGNLNGTIPPSIGNSTELKTLSLARLGLSGTLPDSIGSLTKLRHLDVSANSDLGGDIPETIGNLTELESLHVGNCAFTSLPESIGNLIHLRFLDISGNHIAQLPSTIGNLKELRILRLLSTNMTGPLHRGIEELTKLEDLMISANRFTNVLDLSRLTEMTSLFWAESFVPGLPFPSSVHRLSKLSYLHMFGNGFVGTLSRDFFSGIRNLERFTLSGNRLNGTIPPSIMELRNLTLLDLSGNEFEGAIPDLSALPLESISVRQNRLSGPIPPWIANLTGFSTIILTLSNNSFSGTLPDFIGTVNVSFGLDLAHNQLTGGLPSTLSNKSRLTSLDVSFNAMRLCPTNVVSLPRYLGCSFHHQNVSDYDCGCRSPIFSRCSTSPKVLKECVPCESGAPPSKDLTWQCRDGYWFYNAFLDSLPSPYAASPGIESSIFEMVVTASGNAYSNRIDMHESSAALIGNLNASQVTFHGLRSFLNVSRCLIAESITVILLDEDIPFLKGNNGTLVEPLISYGTEWVSLDQHFNRSACPPYSFSLARIDVQPPSTTCSKFSLSPTLGSIFMPQFTIDDSPCGRHNKNATTWRYILAGTVAGVIFVAIIIALLSYFASPIRGFIRPSKRRDQKIT